MENSDFDYKAYYNEIERRINNPIEFTLEIYRSSFFRNQLQFYIDDQTERLRKYEKLGTINKKSPLVRLWKQGDLNFEFFIGHCVPVYFKTSSLPADFRKVVREFIGIVLNDYRIMRNERQRKSRERRRIDTKDKQQNKKTTV